MRNTASFIRRHIYRLKMDRPFTTRDFLSYGSRGAIDMTLWRLVKNGTIYRLARGVFARSELSPPPHIIAETKAKAFGKQCAIPGAVLAANLGFTTGVTNKKYCFFVNGSSSSFRYGQVTIYLRKAASRKIALQETKAGQAIRALWSLGKRGVTTSDVRKARKDWLREDRLEAEQQSARWQPAWLARFFVPPSPAWHELAPIT